MLGFQGDSFLLAFHEAIDAFSFALDLQEALNHAPWPRNILRTLWCCEDRSGRRGLRVKISIIEGVVESRRNAVTARTEYSGPTMDTVRSLEKYTLGGQILTTFETWRAVIHLSGSHLGSPQVAHLGSFALDQKRGQLTTKRILELAPRPLPILGKAPPEYPRATKRATSKRESSLNRNQ